MLNIEAKETVGVAHQLVSFKEAIDALRQGKRVRREYWDIEDCFIFMQVPSSVPMEFVPKMTSLPQSVKDEFERRNQNGSKTQKGVDPIFMNSIRYRNQIAVVFSDNSIEGWAPGANDILEEDWIILD